MASVHVNGIDIHHEVFGPTSADVADADVAWVLNIGGTGGDLRQTFPGGSPLNKRFRVVHYDQRGLGQTSRPDGEWTMADYADDAAALIEALILSAGAQRCHVVGTSFGGMVALNLALRRPDLIDRMVLLVTSPGGEHASYRLGEVDDMEPDEALATRLRLFDRRWDPSADEPIPGLGAVYDFIIAGAATTPSPEVASGLARQVEARDHHDVVDQLVSITHPTFIGCGRYDDLAPMANSEVLAERMPNARMQVFDGGHLLGFQDRSMWPAVIEFLS